MKVFKSKLICNNFNLLFVISIIYLQSSKNKGFFYNCNLLFNGWFIFKFNKRDNYSSQLPLVDKYDLSYLFFPISSVIAIIFDVTSGAFRLKHFSFSNSFIPLPIIKQSYLRRLTSHSCEEQCIYKQLEQCDYTNEFIDPF